MGRLFFALTLPQILLSAEAGAGAGGGEPGAAGGEGGGGTGAAAATEPTPPGGGGGGEPAAGTPPPAAGGSSWLDSLDTGARHLAETKGWKSAADAVRDYSQLESALGRDKVVKPGKDAKPEDWARFYNEIGRPETADGYDLKDFAPPEGVPWNGDMQTAMIGKMHELGLTNDQVKGVLQEYGGLIGADVQAMQQTAEQAAQQTEQALRKEWGAAYDEKLEQANRVVKAAFGEDLEAATQLRLADGTYLMDHPAVAKAFANLGASMSEDGDLIGGRGGAGGGSARTPAEAKAEIERIRGEAASDPQHPYVNRKHPEYKAMQARMNELYGLMSAGEARR